MTYNLRRRPFRQDLLDETAEVPAVVEEDEENGRSESEENSECEYSDATDATSESDMNMDDAPYLLKKYNNTVTLRRDLKVDIAEILGLDVHSERGYERVKLPKRLRCADCSRKTDKKTNEGCANCLRSICDDHRLIFCKTCSGM
ncbi:hypothetical protein PV327_011101 [Microctonus hyperodae]|uniref:PiggyBac transposable element-derived protein 4 C-terminal zinc-ribbon domain-containing protein n=1 Tax=Microctonus hyperodae TaxID=165561 RepID=A0AA39C7S5_MICHY|nr:hypothetical protein PV327_011101 [Microctonus hyperodae]